VVDTLEVRVRVATGREIVGQIVAVNQKLVTAIKLDTLANQMRIFLTRNNSGKMFSAGSVMDTKEGMILLGKNFGQMGL
jgi:hypothetical protein